MRRRTPTKHLQPEDRNLDIGAGIGSIEERFPGYGTTGLDLSWNMLRIARSRVGGRLIAGDARALPIRTNVIDTVVLVVTLEFVSEAETVLSEAVRVLDPD